MSSCPGRRHYPFMQPDKVRIYPSIYRIRFKYEQVPPKRRASSPLSPMLPHIPVLRLAAGMISPSFARKPPNSSRTRGHSDKSPYNNNNSMPNQNKTEVW